MAKKKRKQNSTKRVKTAKGQHKIAARIARAEVIIPEDIENYAFFMDALEGRKSDKILTLSLAHMIFSNQEHTEEAKTLKQAALKFIERKRSTVINVLNAAIDNLKIFDSFEFNEQAHSVKVEAKKGDKLLTPSHFSEPEKGLTLKQTAIFDFIIAFAAGTLVEQDFKTVQTLTNEAIDPMANAKLKPLAAKFNLRVRSKFKQLANGQHSCTLNISGTVSKKQINESFTTAARSRHSAELNAAYQAVAYIEAQDWEEPEDSSYLPLDLEKGMC